MLLQMEVRKMHQAAPVGDVGDESENQDAEALAANDLSPVKQNCFPSVPRQGVGGFMIWNFLLTGLR